MSRTIATSRNKDIEALIKLAREQGWDVNLTGGGHVKWDSPAGGESYYSSNTPSKQRTILNIKADLSRRGLLTKTEWKRKIKEQRQDQSLTDLKERLEMSEPDELQEEVPMDRELWPPPEDQRINCPDCPEFFWNTDHDGLIRHLQSDHGKAPCPDCFRVMLITSLPAHAAHCRQRPVRNALSQKLAEKVPDEPVTYTLPVNWREPQADGLYHCDQCDKTMDTENRMKGHRTGAHGKHPKLPCEKCGLMLTPGNRVRHVCGGRNRKVACPNCGRVMQIMSLQKHMENHCHGTTIDKDAGPIELDQSYTPEDRARAKEDGAFRKAHPGAMEPPAKPAPKVAARNNGMVDDDDLWAALEIIIGDSIPMRAAGAAVEWIDTTKKLIELVNKS